MTRPGARRQDAGSAGDGAAAATVLPPSLGGGLYIDELFDEIAPLEPGERERVLADKCAGHPSVEAEVRALLDAVAADPQPTEEALVIEPGAVVGRYRLDQRIGAGATASVWKAYDTHLHSFTALKLLHPDGRIRGPMALDAVLREARAASGIISDHVVRIKTAGRFDRGPYFVEMELCAEHRPGGDGSEVLEIGRTLAESGLSSVEETVRVVAEAARGVDAAHRAGVLHRDLKPGNILLTPVGRRAKVTDFGLAAEQLCPAPTLDTPSTATVTVLLEARDGRIVGTPAYMPPEQAMGQPATRAGDVYALGATLYALLAARPPYEPSGKLPMPALDVVEQVRTRPPRPLGAIARVPARLVRIVDKAMARSPRDRYQTAAELAVDLERWLANRAASTDGRAPILWATLFVRRNRSLVSSVAVLGGALLLFALAVGWLDLQRRDLERAIASARTQLREAEVAAHDAAIVRDRTLEEKEQALTEARIAERARLEALSGQSDAEDRAHRSELARLAAERGRTDAEAARASMEADRDVALVALDHAEEETAAAREAELQALIQAQEEVENRVEAERALRSAQLALNQAHIERQNLEEQVAFERAARESAEARVEELAAELALRGALGPEGPVTSPPVVPSPSPTLSPPLPSPVPSPSPSDPVAPTDPSDADPVSAPADDPL